MSSQSRLNQLAGYLLDAFSVDVSLYQREILAKVRDTEYGEQFVLWAQQNPLIFESLVRALSVFLKQSSRKLRGQGMLRDAIADQLTYLPVEFHRMVLDEVPRKTRTRAYPEPAPSLHDLLDAHPELEQKKEEIFAVPREASLVFPATLLLIFRELDLDELDVEEEDEEDIEDWFSGFADGDVETLAQKVEEFALSEFEESKDRAFLSFQQFRRFLAFVSQQGAEIMKGGWRKSLSDPARNIPTSISPEGMALVQTQVEHVVKKFNSKFTEFAEKNFSEEELEEVEEWKSELLTQLEDMLSRWVRESKPETYTKVLLQVITSMKAYL